MSLFSELKRRNVFRVAAAYVVVGWLITEVLTTLLPTFGAPEWVAKAELVETRRRTTGPRLRFPAMPLPG